MTIPQKTANTLLQIAINRSDPEAVIEALSLGASVNIPVDYDLILEDRPGRTRLYRNPRHLVTMATLFAMYSESGREVLKLMIAAGVDMNPVDEDPYLTPVGVVSNCPDETVDTMVTLLHDAGADFINAFGAGGFLLKSLYEGRDWQSVVKRMPIFLNALEAYPDTLKEMINIGYDDGIRLIHLIAKNYANSTIDKHEAMGKILISLARNGADIEYKAKPGQRNVVELLHAHPAMIQELIANRVQYGFDFSNPNKRPRL